MYGRSEIYELDGCVGMILACDLNEMVGIEVAWCWHERKFYICGLGRMSWYEF